jgi:hypothetical protein
MRVFEKLDRPSALSYGRFIAGGIKRGQASADDPAIFFC